MYLRGGERNKTLNVVETLNFKKSEVASSNVTGIILLHPGSSYAWVDHET